MTSTSCNSAVPIDFDVYGFAILSGQEAERDGELDIEDGRCHVYRSVYYQIFQSVIHGVLSR